MYEKLTKWIFKRLSQQRQQKVQERMATTAPDERPSIDVFKNIFSDSDSDSDDNNDSRN